MFCLVLKLSAVKKKKFFTHQELHQKWMRDPEYRREYEKLEPEFQTISLVQKVADALGLRVKVQLLPQ